MLFTKQEYETILKEQGKSIEQYIQTEIQPYMVEEIEIPFGDIVHRGRYDEIKEHEFTLYVRKDEIYGRCGGLTIYFDLPEYFKGTCGCIDVYNDFGHGGSFLYNLCLNWKRVIKPTLFTQIDAQKRSREAVLKNFEV